MAKSEKAAPKRCVKAKKPASREEKRYYSTARPYYRCRRLYPVTAFCRKLAKLFMPAHENVYDCDPPDEPAVFCANHSRAYGPIVMLTRFRRDFRPWTIGYLCYWKSASKFLYSDCITGKTRFGKFWAKIASVLVSPLAISIFRGVESIPVFYDTRMAATFRKSVETLKEGKDIVIFPEPSMDYHEYDKHFSIGFVSIARSYFKATGKRLKFYPVYCCKKKRKIVVGEPALFNPEAEYKAERDRVGEYILRMMMDMALYYEEGRTSGCYAPREERA